MNDSSETDTPRPLWAPWRMAFIRGKKTPGCFMCAQNKQFKPEEEELIVAKRKHVFIILNRYPYSNGHLLVAPYAHAGSLEACDTETRHELIDTVPMAIAVLKKTMNPDGFNCGFNFGTVAGAGVADHIHFHVVPRWLGDNNFMPVIGDIRVIPEALTATAEMLRTAYAEMYPEDAR